MLLRGKLDILLDTESLNSFIDESETAAAVFAAARRAGIMVSSAANQVVYGRLLRACDELGVRSVAQLDAVLKAFSGEAERYFEFASDLARKEMPYGDLSLNFPAVILYGLLRFAPLDELANNDGLRPLSPLFRDLVPAYVRKFGPRPLPETQ